MKHNSQVHLFILVLCIAISGPGIAQSVQISPAVLSFTENTAKEGLSVTITNSGKTNQTLKILSADWRRDSLGQHQFFLPETLPTSCTNWIQYNQSIIDIPANSEKVVTIYLKTPDQIATNRMYWSMLLFRGVLEKESFGKSTKSTKTGVEENYQIGVHIYYQNASNINASAILKGINSIGDNLFNMHIENTGNTQIHGLAHLELLHLDTGEEFTLDEVKVPVFPGYSRILTMQIPDSLPKGQYSALGILDYGEEFPLEGYEFEFLKP